MDDILKHFGINCNAMTDEEVEAYEARERERLDRERRAVLESNYRSNSGIPNRYKNESIESYIPSEENRAKFERLKSYIDSVERKETKKNLCVITGKNGTGKTHLACGIIRQLGGFIITSLGLCLEYESCRDFKAERTRIQLLREICNNRVLVIDEVGKGERAIEKLILPFILNEFYGSGNLLVLVGNITKSELDDIIGEAGTDRMNEVGIYFPLIGESHRKSQKVIKPSIDN